MNGYNILYRNLRNSFVLRAQIDLNDFQIDQNGS